MNAKSIVATVALLTSSLTAVAGDLDGLNTKPGDGRSRAEVKAELHRALAKGEIVHGDLAVLHELVGRPLQPAVTVRVADKTPAPQSTPSGPAISAR